MPLSARIALLFHPFASAAPAQASLLLGSFGGALSTPVIVDDWGCVPSGTTLTARDVAQAGDPVVRHGEPRCSAIGGVITGLVHRGDYLYASWRGFHTESAGVVVQSIAGRAQPVLLAFAASHFEIDTLGAHAATVHGSDVLLLTRVDRFTILDESNPQAPQAGGEANLPAGVEARDMAVLGDKSLLARHAGCDSAFDLALDEGNNTFYPACVSGMHVVDVSMPDSPQELGLFPRSAYSMSGVAGLVTSISAMPTVWVLPRYTHLPPQGFDPLAIDILGHGIDSQVATGETFIGGNRRIGIENEP